MAIRAADRVTLAVLPTPTYVRTYYLVQESTLGTPAAPTANPPAAPWTVTEPNYTAGATTTLYTVMLSVWGNGYFEYGQVQKSSAYEAAKQAYNAAVASRVLAEGLYQVIPSVTEPTTSPTGALKNGDQWWKIGPTPGPTAGKFIGVAVWNGSAWQDRQMVADSVLVPSSVGSILLADGAIDFQVGRGVEIYGGKIVGGELALADVDTVGETFSDTCENLTPWETFGGAIMALSTTRRSGTHSIQVTGTDVNGQRGISRAVPGSGDMLEGWLWASAETTVYLESGIQFEGSVVVPANTWTRFELGKMFAGAFGWLNIWTSGFTGTLRVDDIKGFLSEELPDSGLRLYRDETGLARLVSYGPTGARSSLNSGSLVLDNRDAPGSVTLTNGGLSKLGAGIPLDIGHDSAGANSPLRLYASGSNQIEMLSPVKFVSDSPWQSLRSVLGLGPGVWPDASGMPAQIRIRDRRVELRGVLENSGAYALSQLGALTEMYRPPYIVTQDCDSALTPSFRKAIRVLPNGEFRVNSGASGSLQWWLDGIWWSLDA